MQHNANNFTLHANAKVDTYDSALGLGPRAWGYWGKQLRTLGALGALGEASRGTGGRGDCILGTQAWCAGDMLLQP